MTFSHKDAMNLKNEMKPLFLFVGVFSSKQKLFWNPGLTFMSSGIVGLPVLCSLQIVTVFPREKYVPMYNRHPDF